MSIRALAVVLSVFGLAACVSTEPIPFGVGDTGRGGRGGDTGEPADTGQTDAARDTGSSDTASPDASTDASDAGTDSGDENQPPVTAIAPITTAEAETPVSLDGSGSTDADGEIVRWAWTLGDGATADGETIEHTWLTPGEKTVALTVTDDDGATNTVEIAVSVDAKPGEPAALARVADTPGVVDVETTLDATGSSSPSAPLVGWRWTLTDPLDVEHVAEGSEVPFTPAVAGTWQVHLEVEDDLGDQAEDDLEWYVGYLPEAVIVASTAAPVIGDTIVLHGRDSTDRDDAIVTREWTLPDGSTTEGEEVSIDADALGELTVSLRVVDEHGLEDIATWAATVREVPVNAPPTIDIGEDRDASTGEALSFSATTRDPDGRVVSVAWDFGDGATATGTTALHAWSDAGTFTVEATATDDDGGTATDTVEVTIARPNTAPTARFTWAPMPATPGAPITFDASTSFDTDGDTIIEYRWRMGDGSPDRFGDRVVHAFTADGRYTVELRVTDERGTSATITQAVNVSCAPDCYAGPYRVLPFDVDEPAEGTCPGDITVTVNPVDCDVIVSGASMTMTCGTDVYRGTITGDAFSVTLDRSTFSIALCGSAWFEETITGTWSSPDRWEGTSNLALRYAVEDPWFDCLDCEFDPFPKTGNRR